MSSTLSSPGYAPKLPAHVILCIVAVLFPLIGIAIGAYGATHKDPAWQNTGRTMLICAVAGIIAAIVLSIMLWVLMCATGMWFTGHFIVPMISEMEAASNITATIKNWHESKELPSKSGQHKASSGSKFIVAYVIVTNKGEQKRKVGVDELRLTTRDQNVYIPYEYEGTGLLPVHKTLQPGESMSGYLAFEIDENTRPAWITYTPVLGSSQ